jgi:hypothetical protein
MEKCVTVTAPDGKKYFRGACTNCRYVAHMPECSFHDNYKPKNILKGGDGETGEGNQYGGTLRPSRKGKENAVSEVQNTGRYREDDEDEEEDGEPTAYGDIDEDEEDEEEVEGRETKRQRRARIAREQNDEELLEIEFEREPMYRAGPDKKGGYRLLNWWYPEIGGQPFWPGMSAELRREREEQEEHLIDLEVRMKERRGPRGDVNY